MRKNHQRILGVKPETIPERSRGRILGGISVTQYRRTP